jgi:hypothetical protein
MTRKHFIKMAAEIKLIADMHDRERTASTFIDVARSVNARFDVVRFRTACDLPNG